MSQFSATSRVLGNNPVGLIGFGAFGRLIAQHLSPLFSLCVFDPALGHGGDNEHGVVFADLARVARGPIVILATPLDQLEHVAIAIRPHLKPGALVLDVCSVKAEPARILRKHLPDHVDIIGTHPLFGPQSARNGLRGLKIALCPIRGECILRVSAFLRSAFGLRVCVTTPEDHDREAAIVQGLTHFIARILVQMEPLPHRMTTASFEKLMTAVDMVRHDSEAVFLAIEQGNPFSAEMRERFLDMAEMVQASLVMHGNRVSTKNENARGFCSTRRNACPISAEVVGEDRS